MAPSPSPVSLDCKPSSSVNLPLGGHHRRSQNHRFPPSTNEFPNRGVQTPPAGIYLITDSDLVGCGGAGNLNLSLHLSGFSAIKAGLETRPQLSVRINVLHVKTLRRFAKPHWSGRFSGRAAIVPGVELRPPPRRRTCVRDKTGRATGWTPVPAAPRPRKAQERRDASLRTPRSRPASRARRHAGPALLRARGPGRGEASAGPRDAAARPSARRRWRSRAGGRSRPGAAASSRRPPSSRRLPAAGRGARSGSGRSPNRSMAEAPLHTLKAPAPSVTAAQALTSRL
jgi:hypothetical protein